MSEAQTIRVLLVEDDDEDALIFCRHADGMKGLRMSVAHVATVAEAMSRLAAAGFDLVFIDLNLESGGTGMDMLKRLRNEGEGIPAVVVTGSGDETRAVEAIHAGAYDYLPKDALSADLLERTVRNALQRLSLEKERARMIRELRELSVTDELTGIANRRSMMRKLEEEVWRSDRTGHSFALLMLDLDHFKEVNDRHGHQKGDQVLRRCAAVLQQNVRRTDLLARYGGEEFCVLLPETSLGGARRAAEKVRQAVVDLPPPVPTVSVGVACWQARSSFEDMLRQADEALYKAKAAGRNRVVAYGDKQNETALSAPRERGG